MEKLFEAYICVTISHKGNFKNGTAKYILVKMSRSQLDKIHSIMKDDPRPSTDHCIKIFTNGHGQLYGRWSGQIQQIVENCPTIVSSYCKRGDSQYRKDYHYWYCHAVSSLETEKDRQRAVNCIKTLNERYDNTH